MGGLHREDDLVAVKVLEIRSYFNFAFSPHEMLAVFKKLDISCG